jgi:putative membrane protein
VEYYQCAKRPIDIRAEKPWHVAPGCAMIETRLRSGALRDAECCGFDSESEGKDMMGGWGWGMGLLGGLGMLLFWGLIIGLVVWLIVTLTRSGQSGASRGAQPDSALETLRRRLAAGEITPQEFDALRQKLGV